MTEQIAQRHFARDVGIVHLKPRQVLGYGVVPCDLALVHQNAQRRRRKGFRIRGDAEQCVRIDRRRFTRPPHPVAPGQHNFAIFYHRHGDPRDLKRAHRFGHVRVQIAYGSGVSGERPTANQTGKYTG